MSRTFPALALIALSLVACDSDVVEKGIEKKIADEITKATGREAAVDLTKDGGTVTVGDDQVDFTTGVGPRRAIPKDIPLPEGGEVTSVIPGVKEDLVRISGKGSLRETVDAYHRRVTRLGYQAVEEAVVAEGMLWSRWRKEGRPGLSLLGHRNEDGTLALTLVVERRL